MKNFLIFTALLLVITGNIFAQNFSEERGNYAMGIGPYVGYKLGINAADPPDGIENGVGMPGLPDFGASFYLPLNPAEKMGLFIDAGYNSYGYVQKFYNSTTEWTDRFNYLTFSPNFFINGFTIGLNIGIPLGGERVYTNRTDEIPSELLSTMFEFKVGGNFTLNESELGRFIIFIDGSYQINGQYTENLNNGSINLHPASIQVGLSYLFNMQ